MSQFKLSPCVFYKKKRDSTLVTVQSVFDNLADKSTPPAPITGPKASLQKLVTETCRRFILLLSVNAMLGDTHFDENRDSQFQPRCWVTRLTDCVDSKIAGNRYWDRKCSWEGPFRSDLRLDNHCRFLYVATHWRISPNRLDIVLASYLTGRIRTADQVVHVGFLSGYLGV